jgi:hypothetical protein
MPTFWSLLFRVLIEQRPRRHQNGGWPPKHLVLPRSFGLGFTSTPGGLSPTRRSCNIQCAFHCRLASTMRSRTKVDVRRNTTFVNNFGDDCASGEFTRRDSCCMGLRAPSGAGSGVRQDSAPAQSLFGSGAWPQPARRKNQPQNLTLGTSDAVQLVVYSGEKEPLQLCRRTGSRWHLSVHSCCLGRHGSGTALNLTHAPEAGSKRAAPVEP